MPGTHGKKAAPAAKPAAKPGAKAAPAAVDVLGMPESTPETLAAAQKLLKDEAQRKRCQSNMRFALQQAGTWDAYLSKPMPHRKLFFESWCAREFVSDSKRARKWEGNKRLQTEKTGYVGWEWCSKKKLVDEWGEVKFRAKLDLKKLVKRADPDTGLSDEDNAEFKLVKEGGQETEV